MIDSTEHSVFAPRHRCFALLDAAAGGILAVVPVVAVKHLHAADWQLALRMPISALGMFAGLILSAIIATRPKRPFLLVPGMLFALSSLVLAVVNAPLPFLLISGAGILFENITRPAFSALIRAIYPPPQRNSILGSLRAQTSLVFLTTTVTTALVLDHAGGALAGWIRFWLALAGLLSLLSWASFLGWKEPPLQNEELTEQPFTQHLLEPLKDGMFRHYLLAGGIFAAGGMLYMSLIPAFLGRDLGCGYASSILLLEVIPLASSALATGRIGRWLDGRSVWNGWVPIRIGWALDAFLLALAPLVGSAALFMAGLGRVSRGSVQAASWVLWWQTGIAQLAPTTRAASTYLGLALAVNGIARLIAPPLGAALVPALGRPGVFVCGGAAVLLSALYCLWMEKRSRRAL